MKSIYNQKPVYMIGLHLLLAVCILFGGQVLAKDDNVSGAEVRTAYQNVLDATEAIAKQYGITGADELFLDARNALAETSDDDLAPLAKALPKIQQWHQITQKASMILANQEAIKGFPVDKSLTKSANFPDADYYHPLNTRPAEITMWIGMEVFNLAEAVQMEASRVCEQVGGAFGLTANTSLACIPTDLIYIAAKFVWTSMERWDNDFAGDEAEASYLRLGHLHDDMTANAETIDLIYAALLLHIDESRAWNKLDLRTKIENNLARHGQQVHSLATFILPQQYGGHLEFVREIVEETITNMISAGQKVFFAEAQMIKGDDEFASGNYKKAYDYYGEAYLSATK